MLVSALETESSVKLLEFGTPFHGQKNVCCVAGEAKERVASKQTTTAARWDMTISGLVVEECNGATWVASVKWWGVLCPAAPQPVYIDGWRPWRLAKHHLLFF